MKILSKKYQIYHWWIEPKLYILRTNVNKIDSGTEEKVLNISRLDI